MGQRLIISENERSQIAKMYGLVNEQSFTGNDGYDNSQVNYNLSFVYPTDLLEKIKTFRTSGDIVNYMRSLRPQKNENWFKVLPDVKFRPFEDLLALYPSIGNEIMNRFKGTGNLRDNNPEVQKLGQILGSIRKNGEKNLLSLTRWMETKLGRTENGEDTPLCKDEELADLSKQPGTKIISLPAPFNSQYYLVRNKPYCYTEA